jgi:putative ABC transport system substrate-binding protein
VRPRGAPLALALGLALAVTVASGARAETVVRLGLMSPDASFAENSPLLAAFRQGLAERGWVEGRNVELIRRYSHGDRALFLGASLVALHVDLIVAASTLGARIARDATGTIPIVFVGVSDPLGSGLVSRLEPPRGENLAGLTDVDVGTSARSLMALRAMAPTITRVAVLANPDAPRVSRYVDEVEIAARTLGVVVHRRMVRQPEEMPGALAGIVHDHDQAMIVLPDPLFNALAKPIVDFAAQHGLPAAYGYRSFAPLGGLLTYGTDLPALYRQAAGVVDRILRGAAPGDLPIEGPTKFHLAINLRTAQRLRLTVPDALRREADQLIQ